MIMKKENFEAWMKEQKRILKEQGVPRPPICPTCKIPFINDIDSVTKKVSKYLWKTNCKHLKNLRLSIG